MNLKVMMQVTVVMMKVMRHTGHARSGRAK